MRTTTDEDSALSVCGAAGARRHAGGRHDCTARQSTTSNDKVLSKMLAYSKQAEGDASESDCRPLVRTVDCVDCLDGQRLRPVTIV